MSIRCDPYILKDIPKYVQHALPLNQNILKLENEQQVLYKKVNVIGARFGSYTTTGTDADDGD